MTLATTIAAKLALLVADKTIIDFSRQRDPAAGTELTSRTSAVAEMAAAEVESWLGTVLDSDLQAVRLGVNLALIDYANTYSLTFFDAAFAVRDRWTKELERLAAARSIEASDGILSENDFTAIDSRYPATKWGADG